MDVVTYALLKKQIQADGGEAAYKAVSEYIKNNGLTSGATDEQAAQIEQNKNAIESKISKTGWSANKFLGTDENGNIIEKDAPENSGTGSVSQFIMLDTITGKSYTLEVVNEKLVMKEV